eukprot:scaffold4502_cov119-Isochrysis_galbana.AAC.22
MAERPVNSVSVSPTCEGVPLPTAFVLPYIFLLPLLRSLSPKSLPSPGCVSELWEYKLSGGLRLPWVKPRRRTVQFLPQVWEEHSAH